jgi:hypothetical protein
MAEGLMTPRENVKIYVGRKIFKHGDVIPSHVMQNMENDENFDLKKFDPWKDAPENEKQSD